MDINEINSKDEFLSFLSKGIDKFGTSFNEIKEKYDSSVINKKENLCKIKLMSENDFIIKLLIPYGSKDYWVDYRWFSSSGYEKLSEGKYYVSLVNNNYVWGGKITIFDNLYNGAQDQANQVAIGVRENLGLNCYGLIFQDNYSDRIEIRMRHNGGYCSNGWYYYGNYSLYKTSSRQHYGMYPIFAV